MKITIIGATGQIGQRVLREALSRNHQVRAVGRNAKTLAKLPAEVETLIGDAGNAMEVAALCRGQDLVVNATRPDPGRETAIGATTEALMNGVAQSGARLLVVGGAASLVVPGTDGKNVIEDPRYLPASARTVAAASLIQYQLFLRDGKPGWTYLSPPAELLMGERTGRFRLGGDELIVDRHGRARISVEDLAVALLDEAEHPNYSGRRFTAAY